jgi:hypothetical protein
MAGPKIILGKTVSGVGRTGGYPLVTIIENGNVQEDDEWALFRLTDDGLSWWQEEPDFRMGIMSMEISGQRAVREISPRYPTRSEAFAARSQLSADEQERTLVRSVNPRSKS